jgi:hypothetical protein
LIQASSSKGVMWAVSWASRPRSSAKIWRKVVVRLLRP